MRVLFVASEASPFIKSGGLGDVAGALPKALAQKNVDVRVVIPKYKELNWGIYILSIPLILYFLI